MSNYRASAFPAFPPTPRVALVSGFWGQNIGNAFFNLGGHWILGQAFGENQVAFFMDQPGYRTFSNQWHGNPKRSADLIATIDVDVLVLQGPLLTETALALWAPTVEQLHARGVKVLLLGAALFSYTAPEIAAARHFVERFRPVAVVTRDERTATALRDSPVPIYSGIDSAFALPYATTPLRLIRNPYVALTFNRYPEPNLISTQEGPIHVGSFTGRASQHPLLNWISRRGKWQAYIGAALDRRPGVDELGGLPILRMDHRTNPFVRSKVYKRPGSVASDEPWTYLSVYAGAELVLADRVHACVGALTYGRPAMLFTPSPRSALFEAVGLSAIKRRPVTLDLDRRDELLAAELSFLRTLDL